MMNKEYKSQIHYSKEDEAYLRQCYANTPTAQLVEHLNREANSIHNKAWRMGLKKEDCFWSDEEKQFIEDNYLALGYKEIANIFNVKPRAISTLYYSSIKKIKAKPKKPKRVIQKKLEKPLVFENEIDEVLHEVRQKENYYPIFKR